MISSLYDNLGAAPSASDVLQDFKHFVAEFDEIIRTNSSHLYYSALACMPLDTALLKLYGHMAQGGPMFRRGRLQQWSSHLPRSVRYLAWSPNSNAVVLGCSDHTLRLWDPSNGTPIGVPWKGHTSNVWSVAWSPGGKWVVSGSHDETVRLWDSEAGVQVGRPWEGHSEGVASVAWSPDGNWVVSGSHDKTLRLWDPSTGKQIGRPWEGHTDWIETVAWSPNANLVISGSDDCTLRMWDASMGIQIGEAWKGHVGSVRGVAWSPNGELVISAGADKNLLLWKASIGTSVEDAWRGHTSHVEAVAWSPDSKLVASAAYDNTVRLWKPSSGGSVAAVFEGHSGDVESVGWSPDGTTIATSSLVRGHAVVLWDTATGAPIRLGQSFPGTHSRHVYGLAFAPDSATLVSASIDGTLRIWDTASGAQVGRAARHTPMVSHLSFSHDGKYVVAEEEECRLVWDLAGTEDSLPDDSQLSLASDNDTKVLRIDEDGWIWDEHDKRMLWLPLILRPMKGWGRVLARGKLLAIEIPSVPIIEISDFNSLVR